MASVSRSYDAGGSGGKILRRRRTTASRTPYDRPSQLLPDSAPRNPNWLSKLILSPTRMIATGAGKVLSILRPESSLSSSDDESISEDDSDDADDNTNTNQLEKSESSGKDPGAIVGKSETKRAIEHLLMLETFSREECDRLTHIIKSRVVDSPLTGSLDGRLSDIRNRTSISDVDLPDLCSAALTEAKRWLEVKKLGSNTRPQLKSGTCTLNSAVSPHVTEGEMQSPVDLAKLYMREHSPWSSPSMKDTQLISPSLMGTQLFKEDTPCLYSSHSVPTSKLIRDSPSTGSWNITEEIRKVRSKATEDMLRTRPLSINDVSTLASDNKKCPGSLVADKAESVSQITQVRLLNQASSLDPPASNSQQNQDLVTVRITEEVEEGGLSHRERLQPSEDKNVQSQSGNNTAADGPDGAGQPLNSTLGEDPRDSRSHEINDSALVEVTVVDGEVATNSFPSSRSSLNAGQNGEEKLRRLSEPGKLVNSLHNNTSAPTDESREPLSKSVVEVPIVNENDIEVEASQNKSSMQHDEVAEEKSPSKRKAGKINDGAVTEKQPVERQRYARKAKGRLK